MIFKPAELTPLTAALLAEVYADAGLPAGVFNVVQGDARTGQLLVRHPAVAKVSLTGEVGTGKRVMADAAGTLKHVTMELGGKSPLIIFDDADLEQRGRGRDDGQLLHAGRSLHQRHARLRARVDPRRVPGAARGAHARR